MNKLLYWHPLSPESPVAYRLSPGGWENKMRIITNFQIELFRAERPCKTDARVQNTQTCASPKISSLNALSLSRSNDTQNGNFQMLLSSKIYSTLPGVWDGNCLKQLSQRHAINDWNIIRCSLKIPQNLFLLRSQSWHIVDTF